MKFNLCAISLTAQQEGASGSSEAMAVALLKPSEGLGKVQKSFWPVFAQQHVDAHAGDPFAPFAEVMTHFLLRLAYNVARGLMSPQTGAGTQR